jgi:4'-phosphopantetheinyl transferase
MENLRQSDAGIICQYGFPDELSDELSEKIFQSFLSSDEQKRNQRYRHMRDRRLNLMARMMIRTLLSSRVPEVRPVEWIFDRDIYGKPFISGPGDEVGKRFHFNISHTDGLVAVALSEQGPVGVDVENAARVTDYQGLARRFFAPVEAGLMKDCDESSRAERFFRIWTLKEAYVKAIGKGLAHGLDSFWFGSELMTEDRLVSRPKLRVIKPESGESTVENDWSCWSWYLGDDPRWIVSVVAGNSAELGRDEICEMVPVDLKSWMVWTP